MKVLTGDCLAVLPTLPADSIDAGVTDPPYHLVSIAKRYSAPHAAPPIDRGDGRYARLTRGFMGQEWDGGDIAFRPDVWREYLRVLKPGAHLAAFGGTRTWHRLTVAIEDAGFEIRDSLAWLYGSGFPKSQDVSKAIDKHMGAEREVVAEGKPIKRLIPGADQARDGWIKDNGREYVPTVTAPATPEAAAWDGWGTALKPCFEPIILARKPLIGTVAANVLAHGTGGLNIDACRLPGEAWTFTHTDRTSRSAGIMGEPSDARTGVATSHPGGRWPPNVLTDGSAEVRAVIGPGARVFYCPKAGPEDRNGSGHPTIKPQAVLEWLCRLVCPPGGTLLDAFAGSGSTGQAAASCGMQAILIEQSAEYVADAEKRPIQFGLPF